MDKKSVLLATPLTPSKQTFERLGFTFKESEIPGVIEAFLPENWRAVGRNDGAVSTTVLYDAQNRVRAHSYSVSPSYVDIISGHTGLFSKYIINTVYCGGIFSRRQYKASVFENCPIIDDDTNPFYANNIFYGGRTKQALAYDPNAEKYNTDDPAIKKCFDFLQQNYPDWQNPEAYWD